MNILRGIGKLVLGVPRNEEIIQIPAGQLFLLRPDSSRGFSEHIYKDATAIIRRTTTEFHYQLVIIRIYEEGEDRSLETPEVDEENNEKAFLLDESLKFNIIYENPPSLRWRDQSGDSKDIYEFICSDTITKDLLKEFQYVAAQCLFERKFSKAFQGSNEELEGLIQEGTRYGTYLERDSVPSLSRNDDNCENDSIISILAELHLFNAKTGMFALKANTANVTLLKDGNFKFILKITSNESTPMFIPIEASMNPVFSFEQLSFIFNQWSTDDFVAFSWLLRFDSYVSLEKFQFALMQALWEHLNEQNWTKLKEEDQIYVIEAFQEDKGLQEESNEEQNSDDYHDEPDKLQKDTCLDCAQLKDENSHLAVGYKDGRTFVVQGSKVNVFKLSDDDKLEYSTSINQIRTPNQKELFTPSKVLLHCQDSCLIVKKADDMHNLYCMDLEYGKIVDTWKVHDDITVNSFFPESKYAPTTHEQTLLGISANAIYRIDPRLNGNKLAEAELKQYVSKNSFSTAVTTEKGYIAVASNKGDIRLFDRLGINAKTYIPQLGEPIFGLDVTADGKWILATCQTYLLLVDTTIQQGKNQGKVGFEKSFGRDDKPRPKRLQLT